MATFARPDGVITQGSWTGDHTAIDESSFSDADFVFSQNNPNDSFEVSLSDIADPSSSSGHVLRVRLCRGDADGSTPSADGTATDYALDLVQGTTVIASIGTTQAPTSWTTVELNLSGAEADAITDYTDLRARVTATGGAGSPANRRNVSVSWIELETPSGPIIRTTSDTVTASEAMSRLYQGARDAIDAITQSDSVTRLGTFFRLTANGLSLSDTIAASKIIARDIVDAISHSDSAVRLGTFLREVTDSATYADALTTVSTLARTAVDSLTHSDAATRIMSLVRTATDTLSLVEMVEGFKVILRETTDSLAHSDVVEATLTTIQRFASDALGMAESAVRSVSLVRDTVNAITLMDTVLRVQTALRDTVDAIVFGEVVDGIRVILRSVSDSIGLSDASDKLITVVREAIDTLSFANAADSLRAIIRNAVDSLNFSELITTGGAQVALIAHKFVMRTGFKADRLRTAITGRRRR